MCSRKIPLAVVGDLGPTESLDVKFGLEVAAVTKVRNRKARSRAPCQALTFSTEPGTQDFDRRLELRLEVEPMQEAAGFGPDLGCFLLT